MTYVLRENPVVPGRQKVDESRGIRGCDLKAKALESDPVWPKGGGPWPRKK